jgi:BTB/POZ domain-containing protein
MVFSSPSPIFNAPDADVILRSDNARPIDFKVHRCILTTGSPFFQTVFSLPQPKCTSNDSIPILDVAEPSVILDPFLRFLYPVPDPEVPNLDALVPLMSTAAKYDMTAVMDRLRVLLVSPAFLEREPVRVFAIASRFDLEEEAKIASKHTLRVRVLDVPLCEDLRHIPAHSYFRLLELHQRRGEAARQTLCAPPEDLRCMQCNGAQRYNAIAPPKWWCEFAARAGEELRSRPTTDVIFSLKFLMESAHATGCARCAGSILESYLFLDALKAKIDALPSTI